MNIFIIISFFNLIQRFKYNIIINTANKIFLFTKIIFLLTIVNCSSILSSLLFFKVYFPHHTLPVTKKVYFSSLTSISTQSDKLVKSLRKETNSLEDIFIVVG